MHRTTWRDPDALPPGCVKRAGRGHARECDGGGVSRRGDVPGPRDSRPKSTPSIRRKSMRRPGSVAVPILGQDGLRPRVHLLLPDLHQRDSRYRGSGAAEKAVAPERTKLASAPKARELRRCRPDLEGRPYMAGHLEQIEDVRLAEAQPFIDLGFGEVDFGLFVLLLGRVERARFLGRDLERCLGCGRGLFVFHERSAGPDRIRLEPLV